MDIPDAPPVLETATRMKTKRSLRVLFVPIGGDSLGHSRLRVYDYLPTWEHFGIESDIIPWRASFASGEQLKLAGEIAQAGAQADIVYLYRALLPAKCLAIIRKAAKKLVWDYDDAIYHVPSPQCSPAFPSSASWPEKFKQIGRLVWRGNRYYSARQPVLNAILRECDGVVAGNQVLAKYAVRFVPAHALAPTPIDVLNIPIKTHSESWPVVIGWTGTPDNINYLEYIGEAFRRLGKIYRDRVKLKIVSQPRPMALDGINLEFKQWTLREHDSDPSTFDIGIMPLTDDGWSRGKCGYKALFCMGAGLPTVVSPVGINAEIIQDGVNGFWASSVEEWVDKLRPLIEDVGLRERIGTAGRATISSTYSRPVVQAKIAAFLHSLRTN